MSFTRIVIAVDGAEGGVDALALAQRLAAPATELVAVSIAALDPLPQGWKADDDRELRQDAWARVASLREQRADVRLEVITAKSVAAGLHKAARSFDGDLIIMGSCRRGVVGRILAGDQVRDTLRGAPCPVAIAPHDYALADAPIMTVGVGWQAGDEGDRALQAALTVADGIGARVHALTVVSALDLQLADGTSDAPGIDPDVTLTSKDAAAEDAVQTTMVSGDPAQELARFAAEVDLLVVGSHQRGPVGRLVLGSTSEHLTRHCPRPLMVVPRTPIAVAV